MRVRFSLAATVIAILVAAAAVRTVALRADPPTFSPIGIIWHDEGAWVHNARNRALYGAWRADAWNPVFVTPVFTALEYGAFHAFGVGTWQARLVPVASGLAAVLLLMAGLAALGGSRAAMAGGAMLAVNYVFVMWNRAALIESTMTACIVASWASYASRRTPAHVGAGGWRRGGPAWFTKAAAAFFVGALVIEIMLLWWFHARSERRTAVAVMTGLAATSLVALALFVIPNWAEYRFYNWEMSVLRKPEYTLAALVDRASWLPLVQGVFARMWPVLVAAAAGVLTIAARGVRARPADRLLVLWLLLGLAELIVHDAGNERRYLMFVPVTDCARRPAGHGGRSAPSRRNRATDGPRAPGGDRTAPLARVSRHRERVPYRAGKRGDRRAAERVGPACNAPRRCRYAHGRPQMARNSVRREPHGDVPADGAGARRRGGAVERPGLYRLGAASRPEELRGLGRTRRGAATRRARTREARKRDGPRERHPSHLHRKWFRQLRRPFRTR